MYIITNDGCFSYTAHATFKPLGFEDHEERQRGNIPKYFEKSTL